MAFMVHPTRCFIHVAVQMVSLRVQVTEGATPSRCTHPTEHGHASDLRRSGKPNMGQNKISVRLSDGSVQ